MFAPAGSTVPESEADFEAIPDAWPVTTDGFAADGVVDALAAELFAAVEPVEPVAPVVPVVPVVPVAEACPAVPLAPLGPVGPLTVVTSSPFRVPVWEPDPTAACPVLVELAGVVFEELAALELFGVLETFAELVLDEVDPAGGQPSASSTASCFFAAVTAASSVVSWSFAAVTAESACSRLELFVAWSAAVGPASVAESALSACASVACADSSEAWAVVGSSLASS